ncbi:hypothetical protein PHMEG_00035084, partial [Phytophthora megakarya]
MEVAVKNRQISTRAVRRLPGGGRKPQYQQLEKKLNEWKSLRVKDKYLQLEALNIARASDEQQYEYFKASTIGRISVLHAKYVM